MTPAEMGALTGLISALVAGLTWLATTRNSDRSYTANEEQAFFMRQQQEIEYLAGQLDSTRDRLDETREQLEECWEARDG